MSTLRDLLRITGKERHWLSDADVEPGVRYEVVIDDDGVVGRFEAIVVDVKRRGDGSITEIWFENGVVFQETGRRRMFHQPDHGGASTGAES